MSGVGWLALGALLACMAVVVWMVFLRGAPPE
jgi:hypothetical protein